MKREHGVTYREAFGVWARVAALSFGGPAGQIAVMHRILVEEKRWISEARFLHALNYCMLLPGPEAQQLATYVGWLMHGVRGGFLAGGLFILPGAAAIMALSCVYALFGSVGFIAAMFFGLKAAVLAVVVEAIMRVGKRALKDRVMQAIAGLAFFALYLLHLPFPIVIVAAGLVGFIGAKQGSPSFQGGSGHDEGPTLLGDTLEASADMRRDALRAALACAILWLAPLAIIVATLGPANVFAQIALFFSKMAVVTFGGAYAVLAYVAQQAVDSLHWLKPGEMLDGLGMAETTPGPLIMVLQFVGFMGAFRAPGSLDPLTAGIVGGLLATWVTFTPCFLWIFLGAPYIERLRGDRALAGALTAITAAVVGVILNLAVWFAVHTLFARTFSWHGIELPAPASANFPAILLALGAAAALFYFKLGMLRVLALCAAAGVALYALGLTA